MNSSRLAILTLAIGLAVGFGIGLLKGTAGDSVIEAAGPTGAIQSATGPIPRAGSSGGLTPVSNGALSKSSSLSSRGGTDSAPAVSAQATRLAERVSAAATVDTKSAASWDGVIRGSVLSDLGEPLVGATVVSNNSYTDYRTYVSAQSTENVGRAYKGPRDLEGIVAETAESQLQVRKNTRTAITDSDGRFELNGLKGGMHSLGVYAEGYTFSKTQYEVGSTVEIVGDAVAVFVLDVRLPDGTVPAKAVVAFPGEHGSTKNVEWTAAAPELRLSSSNVEFSVLAGHVRRLQWRETLADFASRDQSLSLERDGKGPHLVQLEATQLCQVKVTDSSGMVPIVQPWVKIVSTEQYSDSDFKWSSYAAASLQRETGEQYAMKDLPSGSYVVGVGRGGDEPEVTEPLQVLEGLTNLTVDLGELDLSSFLIVRCTGPSGRPTNVVSFESIVETAEGDTATGGVGAVKRGQGEYWLVADKLLQNETWENTKSVHLTATSADFGTLERSVSEADQELSLAFEVPSELVVLLNGDHSAGFRATVTEFQESADQNARLHRRINGMNDDRNSKKIDSDGRALFTGKQPGQYELTITKTGLNDDPFAGWGKPAAVTEIVTLRAGTNEVSLTLPTYHSFTVYAPGLKEGTRFSLTPENAKGNDYYSAMRANVGEDERATFEDIPSGTYVLSSRGSRGSDMTVTVPGGEVTFESKEPNSLIVTGVQDGKAGAKAGLKEGDIVTAVDGKSVEGRRSTQMAMMKIMVKTVTLSIRRGNTNLDIQIGPFEETEEEMQNLGFHLRAHRLD